MSTDPRRPGAPPLRFSERVATVEPFLAMDVMERSLELERAGAQIVHLEVGEPDLPAPAAAVEAARRALADGDTGYTDSRGLRELREAIAADHTRRAGRDVDPDQVLVTSGTSPALLLVFSLLCDEGDEVIVSDPHYACYPNLVRVAGGRPVFVPTHADDGYQLRADAVRAALTPRTRAIVVGSPANPTGAIQTRESLEALAELGLPLVCDEIYDGLLYDGAEIWPGLRLDGDHFTLDGFSKRYAMTGFRLGYVIAPHSALRPLQSLAQNLFISASSFVQRAGLGALAEGATHVARMREVFAKRRAQVLDGVAALGLGVATPPAGAFYVFADARAIDSDSLRLARDILERAHVALAPGIDFGQRGEGHLRIAYTSSQADLALGLERLGDYLARR